jgi:hypothetical protein
MAQWHCPGCHKGERGGGTSSELESLGDDEEDEDEEEGEIIFPHSPLLENLTSLGDLFGWQMGAPTSARKAKHP